jgi:hypothetical protein
MKLKASMEGKSLVVKAVLAQDLPFHTFDFQPLTLS